MRILKVFFPLLVILILSLFSVIPFFHPGFFSIHDDTQVARVYEMTKALTNGQFPVRWVEDLGYGFGYPVFNFYDPAPYYVGGVISALVKDSLLATKMMMVLGIVISGLSMYFLAREFWGTTGGILSSVFYMYAPYHAVDIYVRGDVAEFWAYAFIPLVFYGLWKIYKKPEWISVAIASVSFALIIISHNLSAMMVSPFIALFIIYIIYKSRWNKKTIVYLVWALVIGVSLSAFYTLPAIFEMNYTNVLSQIGGGADFRDHFVCLQQLWTSPWGYGGSVKGCNDGLSFMIGKYHIIFSVVLLIMSAFLLISGKYKKLFGEDKEKLLVIVISFLGLIIAALLTLEVSKPVWEIIKPMAFIQYPWRFLLMAAFFASFISGSLLWFAGKVIVDRNIKYLLSLALFSFIVIVSIKFFVPQAILNRNQSFYINDYALKWTTSKTSDEYMPQGFQKPKSFSQTADFSQLNSASLHIISLQKNSREIAMNFVLNNNEQVVLPVAYFPAWQGYVDNKSIGLFENKKGILVNLFWGQHNLTLKFSQTPLESLANLVSLAGIICLFAGIIRLKQKYD